MFLPDWPVGVAMLGDGTNLSFDDIEESNGNLDAQFNPYSYGEWPQPPVVPSEEASHNMSVGYLLNQSTTDSVPQMDTDNITVCYGMVSASTSFSYITHGS